MKKQIFAIGAILLFITLNFSGCEEIGMKPDYITVNVFVTVYVNLYTSEDTKAEGLPENISVSIKMQKDRGEQLTFEKTTDITGACEASGSFKLYKEQFIECTATIQGGYKDFYPLAPAYKMLSWDEVYPENDFGKTYSWYIELFVKMTNSSAL